MQTLPSEDSEKSVFGITAESAFESIVPHRTTRQFILDLFPNLRDAAIRWAEDDAGSMAASVAYYLALSFFPMFLLLISGLGMFLRFTRFGKDASEQLLDIVGQQGSPIVEQTLKQVIEQLQNHSVVSGPTGLIAATLAAIGVFAQLDRGFDRVWRVPQKKSSSLHQSVFNVIRHRFSAFLMLVALGGLIAALFVAGMVFSQLRSTIAETSFPYLVHFMRLADFSFIIGVNTLLFSLIYKFLPKRVVPWKFAFRGGLLTACVWEIGRYVLGAFLIGMRYTSAYGAIGSFIALLLWCYYAMSIIFFGAEYVQVLQRRAEKAEAEKSSSAEQTDVVIPISQTTVRVRQRPRPSIR